MNVGRCLSCFGVAAAIICASCTDGGRERTAGKKARAIVLVSIDTLRADHVGVRGLTPNIDAFASRATTYRSAWSHVPLTLPSHASLLTGLLPTHHGVRDNLGYSLQAGKTLAERLKRAGFSTAAFVSSAVLRRETGIARGFDVFDDRMSPDRRNLERGGSETVAEALKFVAAHTGESLLLFVHLYDPHTPYAAPAEFQGRGSSPYDHEVATADAAFGSLLQGLEERGLRDAAIALTSDHGEGLGDHGEDEHGLLLYAEALHVPLLVKRSDAEGAGTIVEATVREVDVAPTLLALAGLSADGMDGADLGSVTATGSRPAYAESWYPKIHFGWSELASATEGKWHYIAAPTAELYDLSADRSEKSNLAREQGGPGPAMARFIADQKATASVESRAAASSENEEQLRSLGYLGTRGFASRISGENPKDKIGFYRAFMSAFTTASDAQARGDWKGAAAAYRNAIAAVASEKGMKVPNLHANLADCLARLGDLKSAEAEFIAELKLDATSVSARTGLGTLYWTQSRDALARETIGGIVLSNPNAGAAEWRAVVKAFHVLGDSTAEAEWRSRARARGFTP